MSDSTIAIAKVVAVLLADGWHHVIPGSFSVGALNFDGEADLGVLGFRFEEPDTTSPSRRPTALAGRLDSILAVRQFTSPVRSLGYPAREAVPA
jgi:hypothetical protein